MNFPIMVLNRYEYDLSVIIVQFDAEEGVSHK